MSRAVLDASVLLAILYRERFDLVDPNIIQGALLSAVNLAEVLSKARERHLPAANLESLLNLLGAIEPFTEMQAGIAADLRLLTAKAGLSLGDRACIALALELEADIYTAEHTWTQFDFGRPVILIRSRTPKSVQ